jgi:uncharacterized phage infection (PIP) family protein YhgE
VQGKSFSRRSQGSYHQEDALQAQLSALQGQIRHSQSEIETAQANIERLSQNVARGMQWASTLIPESASKVRSEQDKLAALEPVKDKIQAQIDALREPSPAEMETRAQHQKAVAALALERLEIDRTLAKTCLTLCGILEERAEITRRMSGILGEIELTPIDLDESRFDKLRKSLPEDLEGASAEWVDWFLGENQSGRIKTEPYIVKDEVLYIDQTLASAGVFRRGEQVNLTEKQMAEIRSKEEHVVGHLTETLPDGALRSGERTEFFRPRIESVGGGVRSVGERVIVEGS